MVAESANVAVLPSRKKGLPHTDKLNRFIDEELERADKKLDQFDDPKLYQQYLAGRGIARYWDWMYGRADASSIDETLTILETDPEAFTRKEFANVLKNEPERICISRTERRMEITERVQREVKNIFAIEVSWVAALRMVCDALDHEYLEDAPEVVALKPPT